MNASESYWAYWFWFEQLASGEPLGELETGGRFTWGAELIRRYGIMPEGAFIAAEASSDISYRQKSALAKLNASLASGPLSSAAARQDREFVRKRQRSFLFFVRDGPRVTRARREHEDDERLVGNDRRELSAIDARDSKKVARLEARHSARAMAAHGRTFATARRRKPRRLTSQGDAECAK